VLRLKGRNLKTKKKLERKRRNYKAVENDVQND